MLKTIKPEIRIIGWDDVPFTFKDKRTTILGVVCRGGTHLDGVITTSIEVDGNDSTLRISEAINKSPHKDQLRVIMLDGITFGGFNIVDINKLNRLTGLPVIVAINEKPDMKAIRKSLSKFNDSENRWKTIEKAGDVCSYEVKNKILKERKSIFYQKAGVDKHACENIINLTCVNSLIPEPLRKAHLICRGIERVCVRE